MAFGQRSLGFGRMLNAWLAVLAVLTMQCLWLHRGSMIFLFRSISSLIEVVGFRIFVHAACQSPMQRQEILGWRVRASSREALNAGRGAGSADGGWRRRVGVGGEVGASQQEGGITVMEECTMNVGKKRRAL